jgi:hypothetical protein
MITDQRIRGLSRPQAQGRSVTIWDQVEPGLALRVGARGRPSWSLVYRPQRNGPHKRVKLGLAWGGPGPVPSPSYLLVKEARFCAYLTRNNLPIPTQSLEKPVENPSQPSETNSIPVSEAICRYLSDPNVNVCGLGGRLTGLCGKFARP